MERLVGIGEAAKMPGVSITTLRRWDAGNRSRKNQKLIEGVQAAVEAAQC
jgi:hypothetical protein